MVCRPRSGYALTEVVVGLLAMAAAAGIALLATAPYGSLGFASGDQGPEDYRYYELEFDSEIDLEALEADLRERLAREPTSGGPSFGEIQRLPRDPSVVVVAVWTPAAAPPSDLIPLFFELSHAPFGVTYCEKGLETTGPLGEVSLEQDETPPAFDAAQP